MNYSDGISPLLPRGAAGLRTAIPGDRAATKQKVIERLRALSPSLVASGAIVDARHSSLVVDTPRKRRERPSRKK